MSSAGHSPGHRQDSEQSPGGSCAGGGSATVLPASGTLPAPGICEIGGGVFRCSRRVEFRDTDAAGMVHFSAFFVYMEQAEHELLRHLGLTVSTREGDAEISWPRVSASCDFRGPARFEEILQVEVRVQAIGRKSVTYGFRFTRDAAEIATGRLTAVCCRFEHRQPPRSIEIPEAFRRVLERLSKQISATVTEDGLVRQVRATS